MGVTATCLPYIRELGLPSCGGSVVVTQTSTGALAPANRASSALAGDQAIPDGLGDEPPVAAALRRLWPSRRSAARDTRSPWRLSWRLPWGSFVPAARRQVVEPNQVDVVAPAVSCRLKEVFHARET